MATKQKPLTALEFAIVALLVTGIVAGIALMRDPNAANMVPKAFEPLITNEFVGQINK